ncbi:cytochrome ubiquinol oxidase subunit I [Desulfolutivibrio sulfoxidireducens]|uniref:cytochrome ubiquinol oxidase subunit I n=1 Tax=Desulfolutivibrio sulfoxidireducens TaxID=2773299 RepID=UPI00159E6FE3|nr:cytochrome ubiquinol oxidase subunit I [Desulfolutivibrio sulfoxidireducens]QLA14914.1 cytochrome ubiquinol oxidase subunit I [Desulfolutivibrio sulfoxidireducens]QLA18480.1 cytochrome ubiquinol oxidase subunit I [Desulfolutivibrio sulfoxidireducens]
MDTLMLSRLQFAFATFIHFIFVPLTLGLSILVAYMETKYVRTGDETYKKMAKFWGKLFLINFALGVVTGITLEFQFGTNWSRYSAYVGDIFGSLLAIEATAAFFLESTFLGVWIFGWDKLSKKFHAVCIWIVAFAASLSALWIILANGFMQNPVGYEIRNGRAELSSFFDVITNGFAWSQYFHTITGAYALAGFFVMGVSAWHLLRKHNIDFFTKSFRIGATFGLVASILVAVQGHSHGNEVAAIQPAKLAAMESHWDTGKNVPMYLLTIPDEKNERNSVEAIGIPSLLSILAFSDPAAEVKGLKDFAPEDRPPVTLTFLSFRLMVGLGTLMILLAAWGFLKRGNLLDNPGYLRLMVYAIPVPYLALQAGWAVAEVGRQPWIVHGLMRTKDAVSPIATSQVAVSLAAFVVVYLLLAALDIYLLSKYARKSPA